MPRKNTQSTDYPQAVIRQIDLLAQNIVVARKRRQETQAQWAKRLGVSQPTMARIEKGDPSVAMASYVMCMWLIQPDCSLADLIAPQHDTIALEREIAKVRMPKVRAQLSATPPARTMGDGSARTAVGLAALLPKAQVGGSK
jgi:DNA-binding XRE family transcriptional regulator